MRALMPKSQSDEIMQSYTTQKAAARRCGTSRDFFMKHIAPKVRMTKLGRRWLIDVNSVDEVMQELTTAARPESFSAD